MKPVGCIHPLCKHTWQDCVRPTCLSEYAVIKASRFLDFEPDDLVFWCEYPDCSAMAEYIGIVREDLREGAGINKRISNWLFIKGTVRMYVCVRHRHLFRTGGESIDSYLAHQS